MKFAYDPKYNVAYIQFRENSGEVETIRLSDEALIDLAPDGTIFGIELLNANEQLGGSVVVEGAAALPSTILLTP